MSHRKDVFVIIRIVCKFQNSSIFTALHQGEVNPLLGALYLVLSAFLQGEQMKKLEQSYLYSCLDNIC